MIAIVIDVPRRVISVHGTLLHSSFYSNHDDKSGGCRGKGIGYKTDFIAFLNRVRGIGNGDEQRSIPYSCSLMT